MAQVESPANLDRWPDLSAKLAENQQLREALALALGDRRLRGATGGASSYGSATPVPPSSGVPGAPYSRLR